MESINVIVSDTNVENKKMEPTVLDECENDFSFNSPKIEDSLPRENPEVRNWVSKDHPLNNVFGNPEEHVKTRSQLRNTAHFSCFVSLIETKNVNEALNDSFWIGAMQEELIQFKTHDVWYLVPRLQNKRVIGTRWIFKNKSDKSGMIVSYKVRLVARGYSQIEGKDFDETFSPVTLLEFVRLLLAIGCHLESALHQMDVKSAFLNGILTGDM